MQIIKEVENAGGLLAGSGQLAKHGTVNRNGLLHDLDFEQYPDEHCIKAQEIMRNKGIDERIIHALDSCKIF